MKNKRRVCVTGLTQPVPPRSGLVQRIAFYPPKLGSNQATESSLKERRGDKTCWTKPRSRCADSAMEIVSWRNPADHGAWLKKKWSVDDG